ncbi:hypothetical protein [Streptomyces sp. GESEQ-35]|uniref:hypothetical protein n=1 Tax=Streptomyces sp. GESEQ-35 TaxID=2812657 RepID=UPI001B328066|nr:hypothetical protein [Streptomyces sp. GESEQ-35]
MTGRTRKLVVTGAALAIAGLAGGGVALAADGDEPPRDQIRFVVEESSSVTSDDDCPEKGSSAL